MTGRCRSAALAAAAALVAIGSPAEGQVTGTLGMGASIVEYDGFLRSGAAVVAPALRFDTRRLTLAGQGSWTAFESGNRVVQGNLAAAWFAGSANRWRLEFSGAAGISRYAADSKTGHLLAGGRIHVFGTHAGGWFGITGGRTYGGESTTPVEAVAAGWAVRRRLALVGSVSSTWLRSNRYLDLVGALRWVGSGVELEARLGARPWVRSREEVGDAITGGYGEVAVVALDRRVSVSLSGGSYPSDPARRVLGAKYLNAGIRLGSSGSPTPPVSLISSPTVRDRLAAQTTGPTKIEVIGSGPERTIRVRAPGVGAVELMADFTDWTAVPLKQTAAGIWEVELAIPSGVHRVNLKLDGGGWIAPGGGRIEQTEFGGTVGILVVP